MDKKNRKHFLLMVEIFVLLNTVFLLGKNFFTEKNVDLNVVLTGNVILFLLSIFTYNRSVKSLANPNPHAFVRSFYGGFLIRLAVIAVVAFLYLYINNGNVNAATLFMFMGIYAVYAIIEVSALRKMLKEKNNA